MSLSSPPLPQSTITVLVVGAGVAGLSACVELLASKAPITILLVDDKSTSGGDFPLNSSDRAASGISVPLDSFVGALSPNYTAEDDRKIFIEDTLRAGHYENDLALVSTLAFRATPSSPPQLTLDDEEEDETMFGVDDSPNAAAHHSPLHRLGVFDFLSKVVGADLGGRVTLLGGHTRARTFSNNFEATNFNIGHELTSSLWATVRSLASTSPTQFRYIEGATVKTLLFNKTITPSSSVSVYLEGATISSMVGRTHATSDEYGTTSETITGKDEGGGDDPGFFFSSSPQEHGAAISDPADALLLVKTSDSSAAAAFDDEIVLEEEFDTPVDAVILATGGFGANPVLLSRFCGPVFASLPTTNGASSSGSGLVLAEAAGADFVDIGRVQLHPTTFIDPADPDAKWKMVCPEALRSNGALLIAVDGRRYCNELGLRDEIVELFRKTPGGGEAGAFSFILLTKDMTSTMSEFFSFYVERGYFQQAESLSLCAELMHVPASALEATVKSYVIASNKLSKGDTFQKLNFPFVDSLRRCLDNSQVPPILYVAKVTPAIHYTVGGIRINSAAEVLGRSKSEHSVAIGSGASSLELSHDPLNDPLYRAIPGVFAAGEVTGGVHGVNRLGGNGLLEAVVFGRIAAARALNAGLTGPGLDEKCWTTVELREKAQVCTSHFLFRFNLPGPNQCLGSDSEAGSCGRYLAVKANLEDGTSIIRHYSPISRLDCLGYFDLLIKVDTERGGSMSQFLSRMEPGSSIGARVLGRSLVDFSGPPKSSICPSVQQTCKRKLGLIAGGTGISPMIQILRSYLRSKRDDVDINLLYGGAEPASLAFYPSLRRCAIGENGKVNFKMHCTVMDAMGNALHGMPVWREGIGLIDSVMIAQYMHPPADDVFVLVCGPPSMCRSLKAVLFQMGYSNEMVFSFL